MKLIDRIMRKLCDEMEWVYYEADDEKALATYSAKIRAMLTPRCDAVEAVVEAAREDARQYCSQELHDAFKALDEVRDG